MAHNSHASRSDEPEHGCEGRCPETEGNGNDKERGVELRGRCAPAAELQIVAFKFADTEHSADYKTYNKEQHQVREQAVDAEHDEDGSIVARKVAQVVVDPALDLTEVCGLGDALDVEELGDGAQVGESRRDGS